MKALIKSRCLFGLFPPFFHILYLKLIIRFIGSMYPLSLQHEHLPRKAPQSIFRALSSHADIAFTPGSTKSDSLYLVPCMVPSSLKSNRPPPPGVARLPQQP